MAQTADRRAAPLWGPPRASGAVVWTCQTSGLSCGPVRPVARPRFCGHWTGSAGAQTRPPVGSLRGRPSVPEDAPVQPQVYVSHSAARCPRRSPLAPPQQVWALSLVSSPVTRRKRDCSHGGQCATVGGGCPGALEDGQRLALPRPPQIRAGSCVRALACSTPPARSGPLDFLTPRIFRGPALAWPGGPCGQGPPQDQGPQRTVHLPEGVRASGEPRTCAVLLGPFVFCFHSFCAGAHWFYFMTRSFLSRKRSLRSPPLPSRTWPVARQLLVSPSLGPASGGPRAPRMACPGDSGETCCTLPLGVTDSAHPTPLLLRAGSSGPPWTRRSSVHCFSVSPPTGGPGFPEPVLSEA